jgi:hypothetical protein
MRYLKMLSNEQSPSSVYLRFLACRAHMQSIIAELAGLPCVIVGPDAPDMLLVFLHGYQVRVK